MNNIVGMGVEAMIANLSSQVLITIAFNEINRNSVINPIIHISIIANPIPKEEPGSV